MATIWYVLVALMLIGYVLLDGFDLGAGALYTFGARTEEERATVLRSIGPVWDGNEVWLLAAGGTLFYAFPLLYASSFSGFYLPLNIVLWLLIFRAIGIEFRMHLRDRVWREFFDAVFFLSSALLIIFFGAALGNVVRGVPLGPDHYFFAPLWTDLRVGPEPGILDWYTVLCALVALAALTMHGALYVAVKSEGPLNARMRRTAAVLWPVIAGLTVASLLATLYIRPEIIRNYQVHAAGWVIPLAVPGSLAAMIWCIRRGNDQGAFMGSCGYLAAMLGGAAFAMYPTLLPATTRAENAITIYNAAAGPQSLSTGLIWWSAGMAIAVSYFVMMYRMFAGKVRGGDGHYG